MQNLGTGNNSASSPEPLERKGRPMTFPKTILTTLAVVVATAALAGTEQGATSVVKTLLEQVMTIQTDPVLQGPAHRSERKKSVRNVIANHFNFDEMASQSLGKYWKTLSPAQKRSFKTVFKDIFQDSYTRLVLDFLEREQVQYLDETRENGKSRVDTAIVRSHDEIRVEYLLGKKGGTFLVEDVSIDGVSIVENYRNSFGRVIRKKGYGALIKAMKRQQKAIH